MRLRTSVRRCACRREPAPRLGAGFSSRDRNVESRSRVRHRRPLAWPSGGDLLTPRSAAASALRPHIRTWRAQVDLFELLRSRSRPARLPCARGTSDGTARSRKRHYETMAQRSLRTWLKVRLREFPLQRLPVCRARKFTAMFRSQLGKGKHMIRLGIRVAVLLLSGCAAAEHASQRPTEAVPFRMPDEKARLFWDLRGEAPDQSILSVARDAGLYTGVPDTVIDLQCRADGHLRVASLEVRIATDVGDRVKPRLSLAGSGIVLRGAGEWRSTGYELILEDLRLSPTATQLRSLLSGELCLVETWPDGSESRSCYPAPTPALAAKFLNTCGASPTG
jgi:hypothetical protein